MKVVTLSIIEFFLILIAISFYLVEMWDTVASHFTRASVGFLGLENETVEEMKNTTERSYECL